MSDPCEATAELYLCWARGGKIGRGTPILAVWSTSSSEVLQLGSASNNIKLVLRFALNNRGIVTVGARL